MPNKQPPAYKPGYTGMVSAPQPEAVEAGLNVLKAGGNALDAAIACALVQGVVDPLMCGIGGMGVMQIHDPKTGKTVVYEGVAGCPKEASADMWQSIYQGETPDGFGYRVEGFVNEAGATSVTLPGIIKMLGEAHQAHGATPWSELFADAVDCAEQGWMIRPHVYTVFTQNERKYGRLNYGEKLGITEAGRRLYLDESGDYKKPGDKVVNPDLATTLRTLASEGASSLYTGRLGQQMIDSVRAAGGILSMDDLASYQPRQVEAIAVDYRGWTVQVPPPPSNGLYVAEVLKIVEQFDLVALGHNSPEYLKVLGEAMKIATSDRSRMVGDPDHQLDDVLAVLTEQSLSQRAQQIRAGEKEVVVRDAVHDSKHTTHVSVVDKDGMFVSLTHTLGNPSGFIVDGAGYMLNGGMSLYDPIPGRPNSIAPGKRRFSTMAPVLVFDGATPVVSLGAPGASWIGPALAQVLINVLDWGMDMQTAISAPRMVATGNQLDISNRIPLATQRAIEASGYEVRRSHLSFAFAGVHGISRFDGELCGGADPQRDGYAGGV